MAVFAFFLFVVEDDDAIERGFRARTIKLFFFFFFRRWRLGSFEQQQHLGGGGAESQTVDEIRTRKEFKRLRVGGVDFELRGDVYRDHGDVLSTFTVV